MSLRIAQDSLVDETASSSRDKIPVIDLTKSVPLVGSIALSSQSVTPFYANGIQWLPFAGAAGVLESGSLSIINTVPGIQTDGTYRKVTFDTDTSPATPPHPSFTVDAANSRFVINTSGNYILHYNLNPSNSYLMNNGTQPEAYVSQIQTSIPVPSSIAFCQATGSFVLQGGVLSVPPSRALPETVPYTTLSGTWSGFLPQNTIVETFLSITSDNNVNTEVLFGEGGKMQYMSIIRTA